MIDVVSLLDRRIQNWLFQQGWSDLREVQKRSIPPILDADRDVLISASTAAGKTEAFFLPACSKIIDDADGVKILYISPLKALINDQYRRLESLCDLADIKLTSWHGDSAKSGKNKLIKEPSGIILITPESLESLLIRRSSWLKGAFENLSYIVIDEFHAFLGTERGIHLLSLLNRLEHLLERYERPIPRVALSATLGQIETVPYMLRPNQSIPCEIVQNTKEQSTIKVKVQGYVDPIITSAEDVRSSAEELICNDLFKLCRGDSHLVFANSRSRTESIAARLADLCEEQYVPNEFFPHHGSLSKEHREELEQRLQKGTLPTTAICTMTLELGIDIGKVLSVVQVTAPNSVSSLRQRLGRSGRRNNASILRMMIGEKEITEKTHVVDMLRLELVQSLAMIHLLIKDKWFEPANDHQIHFSTLFHQVLAVIAQWGGVRATHLYNLLCVQGPFNNISIEYFKILLSYMGELELLTQLSSGELTLGTKGEKLVGQYTFYSVFKTPEEYRVIVKNKTIGTLPVDSLVEPDQHIIFAGKKWKVLEVSETQKAVFVQATRGGYPPKFGGEGMLLHSRIRKEMFEIYRKGDYRIEINNNKIDFIDSSANQLFEQGARYFKDNNLENQKLKQVGKNVLIFPWTGDMVAMTLMALLIYGGYEANCYAGVIEVEKISVNRVLEYFCVLISKPLPNAEELSSVIPVLAQEKYDEFLPKELLAVQYSSKNFDVQKASIWIEELTKDFLKTYEHSSKSGQLTAILIDKAHPLTDKYIEHLFSGDHTLF